MLDPKEKLIFLGAAKIRTEHKIYDLDLEIRVFKRKQMLNKDNNQLIALETMLTNLKTQKDVFIDKLDIIEEEILANEKLVGKQSTANIGADKEKKEG